MYFTGHGSVNSLEDGISKTIEWASSKKISVNLDKWVKSVR